ncbi:hypothetical protein KI688_005759 [Linnemannia hyalina]|uniref:FAD-binding domain-containing protein n=1 Tax=Linnemannia hyalina TaxID=64524 RepID=A0A9P8BZH8_9FUNG|nr:hypothetical protein KI688_005759 [Linnemannia hyalina]
MAEREKNRVIIVGAGVGGVMLGLLLHKAGIPFDIYERAVTVKPLGSALNFNATTAGIFRQCGIYDELVSMSKHTLSIQVGNENREIDFTMDFRRQKELVGSTGFMVERHRFYDLLLRQIPKERIHMNKKMVSTIEMATGIRIVFEDGSMAQGDILVGADGAYSTVRQNLYSRLLEEKKLLASDDVPLPYSSVALVGRTRALDPSLYPNVRTEDCQFINILGRDKPYSWVFVTTNDGVVCWMVIKYLSGQMSKEVHDSKYEDWGPDATRTMCEEVKDFPIIAGGDTKLTIGDLIEWSPKEYVSKVMLEEKVFDTWYEGRTLNPAGGAGATNAILDVITLSNWIVALSPKAPIYEIEDAFEAYKTERHPLVLQAAASSLVFKTMTETTLKARLIRFVAKHMPQWLNTKILTRTLSNRSQVSFLPLAEDKGTIRPLYQASYVKTLKILEERRKQEAEEKGASGGIVVA